MSIARARQLRNNPTKYEALIWRRFRDFRRRGFHIRRQAPIGPFIVDFACHAEKLVIEIDGGGHWTHEGKARDAERTQWLEGCGYQVLRVGNSDVWENPEGVCEAVFRALLERRRVREFQNNGG